MHRSPSTYAVWLALLACVCVGGFALSDVPALASEGERPAIVRVRAADITTDEATLEAQINPRGSETAYEFWLVCQGLRGFPCEPIAEPVASQRHGGRIAAALGEQTVRVNMTGLQSGHDYYFEVAATNTYGRVEGPLLEVETAESGLSLGAYEASKAFAEGAPRREAERQQAAKEQAEREAAANPRQPSAPTDVQSGLEGSSVSLGSSTVEVRDDLVSLVKLRCVGVPRCRGKLTLLVNDPPKAHRKLTRLRTASIGAVSYSIEGDETKAVRVRLDALGRMLVDEDRSGVTASLAIREFPPSPESTLARTVDLVWRNR